MVRVFQGVGENVFGWDSNRDVPPVDPTPYPSEAAAQRAADDGVLASGHVCDSSCYSWRALG